MLVKGTLGECLEILYTYIMVAWPISTLARDNILWMVYVEVM